MDFYYLEETFQTLQMHKQRSILTGFGVMWGVLSLVVLLGAGAGLKKGVFRKFVGMSKNSIWIWGQMDKNGNWIFFNKKNIDSLKKKFPFINKIAEESHLPRINNIAYKEKNFQRSKIIGVGLDYLDCIGVTLDAKSRDFNKNDFLNERKVCIIGSEVKKELFIKENPIGQYLDIGGLSFKIIGTLKPGNEINNRLKDWILIPSNVSHNIFKERDEFEVLSILLDPKEDASKAEKIIVEEIKKINNIHLQDNSAIQYWNVKSRTDKISNLFFTINIFIWAVSLCFLLSGGVGIGNMMMVIIKERTKEIGIRKVLGAKPNEILKMLMTESIIITLLSGFIGMIFGITLIKMINILLNFYDKEQNLMIANLSFNIYNAIIAILILSFTGAIAGYLPARKIIGILPIKALSEE